MRRVIVTGATGFIGYHLIRKLLDENVEVWAICREESNQCKQVEGVKGVHVIKCDLEHILQLHEICEERNFDAFYHLAWKGASGKLRSDVDTQINNLKWTCDCIEAALRMDCKKIVMTGTICERQCEAIKEQRGFIGASYYLLCKKYAYEMCDNLCKKNGIPLVWCRFYHPIGVYNKKEQLITNTICKLIRREELKFGTGQNLFDAIDVRDLTEALYLMGEKSLTQKEYFVGSGCPRKLRDYLDIVKSMIDPYANMQYGALNATDLPMLPEWLDTKTFQKETGFQAKISFETSVRDIEDWIRHEEMYNVSKWKLS